MDQRVLVVDDDHSVGEMIQSVLTVNGVEAKYINDPIKAVYFLQRGNYDIALIDLHMPIVNGIELATWVMRKCPLITTILMSGAGTSDDYLKAQSVGITKFLHKPFESNERVGT